MNNNFFKVAARARLFPLAAGFLFAAFVAGTGWEAARSVFAQELPDETRSRLEGQLRALEGEAAQIDATLKDIASESKSLENETLTLNTEIKKRELEIRRIGVSISKADLEIKRKTAEIALLEGQIGKSKEALASSLFVLYTAEGESPLTVLLKQNNLAEFFNSLDALKRVQATVTRTVSRLRDDHAEVEKDREELAAFKEEQQELKSLQELERRFLAQKKKEKDELLRLTKGREDVFQKLLALKKKDIAALKTQLFYLEKTGITAEDAVHFADLAARRAGIRTAFLLALLEVETGKQFEDGVISVGSNLGTGNWRDDLYLCYQRLGRYYGGKSIATYNTRAEREKEAFFKITGALGLDPDKMPVSKEPRYIGCGGAMGPAQFLPSTWLLFEKRVAELTGHNPPNPWNHEDAFTAAAIFLADAGARSQTETGEIRAAKTYISGRPSCTTYICNLYSRQIISLAKDIDKTL